MGLFGGEPRELGKAFAIYGAAAPAGGTAGVFLGGVLTEWADWRWVFLVNIPVGLAALALSPRLLPTASMRRGRIDLLGATAITGAISLAVLGIVRAPEAGWSSSETLLSLGAAALLLAGFVTLQAARREPLVPLKIFRAPGLSAANVVAALLGAAWIPMWFFLNLYLQQVLGYGAFEAGAALLPMTAAIMVLMVGVTGRLVARFGVAPLTITGLTVLAAGIGWLALVPVRRHLRQRRPARHARRRGRHVPRLHPGDDGGALRRGPAGGGPRVRDLQHHLPGGLGARPRRHDRGRRGQRRRPGRRPRIPHRRLPGRPRRRRAHRPRRRGRVAHAHPTPQPGDRRRATGHTRRPARLTADTSARAPRARAAADHTS